MTTTLEHGKQAAVLGSDLPQWQLRTLLALLRAALRGTDSFEDWLARHPVLGEALDEAAASGLVDLTLDEAIVRLDERLTANGAAQRWPVERLRLALRLSPDGMAGFVAAGMADADPRLAPLFDALQGQGGRPSRATLMRAFRPEHAAAALQALRAAGCLEEAGAVLSVPPPLWDLALGLAPAPGSWRHQTAAALPTLASLVLPPALHERLARLNSVQAGPQAPAAWLLRGCAGSGRHALAGAIARSQGLGLVEALNPAHAPALGAAAALLGAMPLIIAAPAQGEHVSIALPQPQPALLAVCAPRQGGVSIDGARLQRVDLDPPEAAERRQHWRRAAGGAEPDEALVSLRLPRGTLHRVAQALPGGPPWTLADVVTEVEERSRHALEGTARRLPALAPGERLALPEATQAEFDTLVQRCRHRDRLAACLPVSTVGVRALFKGPSGTGKTLAARQLAAALQRPLYRVDLAATVSKYIGETERNLERVFEAAESLDIVLLLDEGDALMAGRTQVGNATDRYANLETNYLLQRLEQYAGVLVITTNAAERIDSAFTRRLDVTLDFALPDALTRLALWEAHLGEDHAVDPAWLETLALRCTLSGAQIRNAVLHAALLALDRGGIIGRSDLASALAREYRKAGQQCPTLDERGRRA